jgi:hypothetical protein
MTQQNLSLYQSDMGTVECLGQTFPSDEARREHFLKLLGEKLKDPEFRKIEGFPIGRDEDILALSDPPYYTACPNPWIGDYLKYYSTPYDPKQPYHREPFAADVSEGKNHPIYNAHSYHTKVPHRAIMRYILNYTEPGEVIFDGFAGTGMAGVAAQLCGDRAEVQALGYRVRADGIILDEEGKPFSKLGARRAILNDLSPAASFIAYNYNMPVDVAAFEREAKRILNEVEDELGWMYETTLKDGQTKGRVNYTIWSDVFACSSCQGEVVFLEAAVSDDGAVSAGSFECPNCKAILSKATAIKMMEKVQTHHGKLVERIKKIPVLVNYTCSSGRREKAFDSSDARLLANIEKLNIPECCPHEPVEKQREQYKRDALHIRGIETPSDFYTRRNLIALGRLWDRASRVGSLSRPLRFWLTSIQWLASNMYRHRDGGGGGQQGKLTIPSLIREQNVFRLAADKLGDALEISRVFKGKAGSNLIATSDASAPGAKMEGSVDYVFVDPPFGGNIFYSDLNSIWEGWLKVTTNDKTEAVVHRVQTDKPKGLSDYAELMKMGLRIAFSSLKLGRWMTVEFSNSQAAVWNAIQTSLQEAGFVVANVAALDKQQRSFRSLTSTTAVKEDLVISAYKPNGGLEERFAKRGETEEGVWDFIKTHLRNLPVVKANGGQLEFIAERDPRILYDRMVAFYVGHSTPVPLSSAEFQAGLVQRFPKREVEGAEMIFLSDQVNEYDQKRLRVGVAGQLSIFVEDEKSAGDWLQNFLKNRPSPYQDILPDFMRQLGASWKKWERRPELAGLLKDRFLCYGGEGDVPSQIHSYLSSQFRELRGMAKDDPQLRRKAKDRWYVADPKKNIDVEKIRNKRLLDEFWTYLPPGYAPLALHQSRGENLPGLTFPVPKIPKGKKLKELRTEAIRVGFKHCYQAKDYQTIRVVAEMLPESVIQEDEALQMLYDAAVTRSDGD